MRRKLLQLFLAVLAMAAAVSPAWGQTNEQVFYTLDGTQTGGTDAYTSASNITQSEIAWKVTGNTTMNPWRIGGKSITNQDRPIYSSDALEETITKVVVDLGTANSITVNSFTMYVASDAAFNNIIDEKSVTFAAETETTITPTTGKTWKDAYYKFVFNVSVSGSSNKFVQFKSAKFYYDANAQQGGGDPQPNELAYAEPILNCWLGLPVEAQALTNPNNLTVTYSSGNEEVATVDVQSGAITLLQAGNAVITASFEGNSDYAAGTASYLINVKEPAILTLAVNDTQMGSVAIAGNMLPDGVAENTDGTYSVKPGTELTINASAADSHYFLNWTDGTEFAYTTGIITPDETYPASSQITLTVEESTTVQANFAQITYAVLFNAVNNFTIADEMAAVQVDNTDKTADIDDDGKLAGLLPGQTIKLTAETGYLIKFVEGEGGRITYTLHDSYGDGWNECKIIVREKDSSEKQETVTLSNGYDGDGELVLAGGKTYEFVWKTGSYPSECTFEFKDNDGNTLFSGAGNAQSSGAVIYTYAAPEGMAVAYNDALTEATFTVPEKDMDLYYKVVRDINYKVSITMGATHVPILWGDNKYTAVDATQLNVTMLEEIGDEPEEFDYDNIDASIEFKEGDEWIKKNVLDVGSYRYKIVGGGNYSGTLYIEFDTYEVFRLKVPANSFITFYADENLFEEEDDIELYTISSVTDTEVVLSDVIDIAPANTPLLIYNSSDAVKTFLLCTTKDDADDIAAVPEFKGTLDDADMDGSNETVDYFVLTGLNVFMWVKDAGTIAAHKCWLELQKGAPTNARAIVFGETTSLKAIDNGQLTMDNDGWYDLNGRKINMPTKKGVYIFNGRKVVVK